MSLQRRNVHVSQVHASESFPESSFSQSAPLRSFHFPSGIPAPLSERALSFWAKTVFRDTTDERYLQLWQHMEDTGEIALKVWDEFVADDVRRLIAMDVGDDQSAKRLYQFVAAIHDIGKASPAFVVKSDRDYYVKMAGFSIRPNLSKDKDRRKYRHELVGYQAVLKWLGSQDFPIASGTFAHGLADIVAGHHGTSLTKDKQRWLNSWNAKGFVGDKSWSDVRSEFLDWIADTLDIRSLLHSLKDHPLRRRTLILLTALVIIADWIASDTRLCPLNESESDLELFDPRRRADRAWRRLQLPEPWKVTGIDQSADGLFAEQFDIPGAKLRPVQYEAIRMAQTMPDPGLMIVEANMGEGKTEAALLAAEILASRFHCGGVYYALPTQATVNAMFTRILDWIGHLPAEDRRMMASLFLAHGKRELNDDYETLREQWFDDGHGLDKGFADRPFDGIVYGEDDSGRNDEDDRMTLQAVVNSWFTGPKRGNLSTFVTGTIDQVLMAGLQCKHVVLRHAALAGKVVILDEVHSNTAYMNVYMETVLSWLGAYGTPVIMLSATLPQTKRRAFLKAYRSGAVAVDMVEPNPERQLSHDSCEKNPGCRNDNGDNTGESNNAADNPVLSSLDLRYPLISVATKSAIVDSSPAASGRSTDICVSMLDDDNDVLATLLRERLRDGGCAVVIRNTVSRAQETYDVLRGKLDMDVTLAHSRFLAFDRARIDRDLIHRYGKNSDSGQRSGVVVATQVVEQSLDVDFDMMVTDIAPIDLILQRSGRLHRHRRGEGECQRPLPLRKARLYVSGVVQQSDQDPPQFARGLESVYHRYLLMRSLAVLNIPEGGETTISVPDDIPRLVQSVYGDVPVCPESWRGGDGGEIVAYESLQDTIDASECEAHRSRIFKPQDPRGTFTLDDWLKTAMPDPDAPGTVQQHPSSTGVREGDDSFEAIVLQRDVDGYLQLPSWGDFDTGPLPSGMGVPDRRQVRNILSCTIALSRFSLAYQNLDAVINALECNTPQQWFDYMQQDRSLAGQLLIVLDGDGKAEYPIQVSGKDGETMKTLRFQYSMTKGWVTRVE
ncbi:CRISPR-associated helicase/endonuclease Cas3 [Bifidobacterium tissieri]|uniref:CRISPR-associated helicase/endonuclease Cas3 n=1 Tax=Bifidobacterium tissieri TaxID=1630162 RepID=UPI000B9C30C4|nr:CRISPR-associated helicase/endonuclease Cas3 [Bifidobacterium tissieri]